MLILLALPAGLAADAVKIGQSQSHVIALDQPASATILDSRVVGIAPMYGNFLHAYGVGKGASDVTLDKKDGVRSTVSFKVGGPLKIKSKEIAVTAARGHSAVWDAPADVLYVGTGDKKVAVAQKLDGKQRVHIVGAGAGYTDLVVQTKDGVETLGLEILEAPEITHEVVNIPPGGVWTKELSKRPGAIAVADGSVAKGQLRVNKDKAVITVTAVAAGDTDLVVSYGLGTDPVWYSIHVE